MVKELINSPEKFIGKNKWTVLFLGGCLAIVLLALGSAGVHAYTNDAEFCASCHVMDTVYKEWQHSAHREVTNCNDCHTVQTNYVAKTWSKVTAGTGHVFHNTFGDDNQVIRLKNNEVVQQNCLRCHSEYVEQTILMEGDCFRCHRTTPHGA